MIGREDVGLFDKRRCERNVAFDVKHVCFAVGLGDKSVGSDGHDNAKPFSVFGISENCIVVRFLQKFGSYAEVGFDYVKQLFSFHICLPTAIVSRRICFCNNKRKHSA